jgi:hypothetical protein
LQRVKEERNILQKMKRWKPDYIGRVVGSNSFLKHVVDRKIEGRIEVAGRRGRRREKPRNT